LLFEVQELGIEVLPQLVLALALLLNLCTQRVALYVDLIHRLLNLLLVFLRLVLRLLYLVNALAEYSDLRL
jgi:hypothetical protein